MADFRVDDEENVFYVEAEYSGQRSIIKPNEMGWNLSTFNTDGANADPDGLRAYIYTERGVYRPGDQVNLSLIVRNAQNTFPDDHPVTMRIFNPKNQKMFDETHREAVDGFYNFTFESGPEDLTGNWRVEAEAGSRKFYHTLKIETVVPFRLKVNLEPEKSPLTKSDRSLNLELSSNYLFGNPGAGLDAEVNVTIRKDQKQFPQYKGFTFANETMDFQTVQRNIYTCLLYTSPSPRDGLLSRMPSSA